MANQLRLQSLGAIGALSIAGCAPVSSMAAQQFAHQFTCPDDRVKVTALPGDAPHRLILPTTAPPGDVVADPDRLRVWLAQRKAAEAKIDASYKAFMIDGCSQERSYVCGNDFDWDEGHVCAEVGLSDIIGKAAVEQRLGIVLGLGFSVTVDRVITGGASDGRLEVGDVITQANGAAVTHVADMTPAAVVAQRDGSILRLSVLRRGATVETEVRPRL